MVNCFRSFYKFCDTDEKSYREIKKIKLIEKEYKILF